MTDVQREHVDNVTCPACRGAKKCATCEGDGTIDVGEGRRNCNTCSGTGTCVTCNNTGEYERTRPKREPLRTPRAGYELCWQCEGLRHCGACLGSGRRTDGTFCKVCDMHTGDCLECNGDGETRKQDE
jgi:hypothetical protein